MKYIAWQWHQAVMSAGRPSDVSHQASNSNMVTPASAGLHSVATRKMPAGRT